MVANRRKRKPAAQRKPKSARLLELRNAAKRKGWAKWIRQGDGEEADERALLDGCTFDTVRAQHVVDFFEQFGVLTEGAWAGEPFRLMRWQHDWLYRAFGWVKFSDEWNEVVRRFRYLFLEVPKKNGKTPMIATLGNYLFFADSPTRQINMYLAATSKQQAARCLKHATRAYKFREALAREALVKKLEGYEAVYYRDNLWQVVAADAASADGVNGHVIGDEIHHWAGMEFYNTLRWALASQPEGLFVAITTAGKNPESVWGALNAKAQRVNVGREIDQQFFGQIYAIKPDQDPHNEKVWHQANPSLGSKRHHPLKLSTFRADYETARNDPTQWPTWLQLRLGRPRNAEDSWVDLDQWDLGSIAREAQLKKQRRKKKTPVDCFEDFKLYLGGKPFDQLRLPELRQHYPVDGTDEIGDDRPEIMLRFGPRKFSRCADLESVAAIDGATINDTTSLGITWEHPRENGVLIHYQFYWLPENRAIQLQEKTSYKHWSETGFLTLTPGDAVDFDVVFADMAAIFQAMGIVQFYFDPLFQAEWLTQKLETVTGAQRIEFPQTVRFYSPSMKSAQRRIVNKTLRHNGHPLLTWQLGNTKSKSNVNSDIRPVKQKHNDYRSIDGVTTMIMTQHNWATVEDGSYYDDHEVEIF